MTLSKQKATGETSKNVQNSYPASVPHRIADHLRDEQDIAYYLEALLEDGEPQVIKLGLRHVADAIGGMSELARRSGITREALYRALSAKGNPRLSTLNAVLGAFHLRLSVAPMRRAG